MRPARCDAKHLKSTRIRDFSTAGALAPVIVRGPRRSTPARLIVSLVVDEIRDMHHADMPPFGDASWQLVYTKARAERWVELNLRRQNFLTLLPLVRGRTGFQPLFPRYVFVGIEPDRSARPIAGTRGVQYIVHFGSQPARVPARGRARRACPHGCARSRSTRARRHRKTRCSRSARANEHARCSCSPRPDFESNRRSSTARYTSTAHAFPIARLRRQ